MARQGWRRDANGTYIYNEGTNSAAIGMRTSTGNLVISAIQGGGADPTTANQITINPAAGGNITLTPNGDGTTQANTTISMPATTTANVGVIRIDGSRFMHRYNDPRNTFLGANAGNFTLTGVSNTGIGRESLSVLESSTQTTAVGAFSLDALTTGNNNTGVGMAALSELTTGGNNTTVGQFSGGFLNGSNNVLIGSEAGRGYTGTETNNVIVAGNNYGTLGDNNTIRIGNDGLHSGTVQTACYIQGIYGQAPGGTPLAMTIGSNGKIGTTGGTVATSYLTDSGSAVPAAGVLSVLGGTNVNTGGGTSVVTVNLDDAIEVTSVSFDSGTNVLDTFVDDTAWTPALEFGGASVDMTYSTQTGKYSRIGDMVIFSLSIVLTAKGSSTGNCRIDGLPLNPALTTPVNIRWGTLTYTNQLVAYLTTAGEIQIATTVSAGTSTRLTDNEFDDNSFVQITGCYLI